MTDSSGAGHDAAIVEPESAWRPLADGGGSVTASLDDGQPLNDQLTRSLRLDIGSVDAGQRVGMANAGYFGVPAVAGRDLPGLLLGQGRHGPVHARHGRHREGRRIGHGRRVASVTGVTSEWQRFETTLTVPDDAGDTTDNRFVIGIDRRDESAGDVDGRRRVDATPRSGSRSCRSSRRRTRTARTAFAPTSSSCSRHSAGFPPVPRRHLHPRAHRRDAVRLEGGHRPDLGAARSRQRRLGLLERRRTRAPRVPPARRGPGRDTRHRRLPRPQRRAARPARTSWRPTCRTPLDLIEYTIGPVTSTWGAQACR